METITIVGSGYVGTTLAAILASSGYKTYALDIDQNKINILKQGKSFFFELGLDELIRRGVESGNFIPTTSYEEAIPEADIIFSCVGTPDNADGSSNLSYVFSAVESSAKLAKQGVIYVQRSTVPVGTGRKNIELFKKNNPELDFHYVSNPEFLREGAAVYDTINPNRVVVGGDNTSALDQVLNVFKNIEKFAKILDTSDFSEFAGTYVEDSELNKVEYIKTGQESAELIKVTSNAFLATKISFANSIAMLADKHNADVNEVMDGVGFDKRIGRAFLYAGLGYGGGCFPKDVSGLISAFEEAGINNPILDGVAEVNYEMPKYFMSKIQSELPSGKIAVLGLSFKPGTSDTRKSQSIALANMLVEKGYEVTAYDPEGEEEAKVDLHEKVNLNDGFKEAVKDVDAIVIGTEWPEFINADWSEIKNFMKGNLVFDGRNRLDSVKLERLGFKYVGIGVS
jgi:UDPglucose 6-dehydrogenase